jgi:hypothetical protein
VLPVLYGSEKKTAFTGWVTSTNGGRWGHLMGHTRLEFLQLASQHQRMQEQFTAYDELLRWIEGEIEGLDRIWQSVGAGITDIEIMKGKKQGLQMVHAYMRSMLKVSVTAEMKRLEESGEKQS